MSRKKLTGQSKLAGLAEEEKETEIRKEPADRLGIVTRKIKITPTSFRLTPEDKQVLKSISERVNDLSPNKKISDTMIVKALIKNAESIKADRLISMVKEVIL